MINKQNSLLRPRSNPETINKYICLVSVTVTFLFQRILDVLDSFDFCDSFCVQHTLPPYAI